MSNRTASYLIGDLRAPSHLDPGVVMLVAILLNEKTRSLLTQKMDRVEALQEAYSESRGEPESHSPRGPFAIEYWSDIKITTFVPTSWALEHLDPTCQDLRDVPTVTVVEGETHSGALVRADEGFLEALPTEDTAHRIDLVTLRATSNSIEIEARMGELPVTAGTFSRDWIEKEPVEATV